MESNCDSPNSPLSVEEYKSAYRKIQRNLVYYNKLRTTNRELTGRQLSRYNELIAKRDELERLKPTDIPTKRKYANYEEYLVANRDKANQRYQRLKYDEEFKQKQRDYSRLHYQQRKSKTNDKHTQSDEQLSTINQSIDKPTIIKQTDYMLLH